MSKFTEKLRLRRQALVTKSQAERMLLIVQGKQLKQTLSFADMGMQIAAKLAQRPILGVGILVATVIVKPADVGAVMREIELARREEEERVRFHQET